jgi:hypothetical protein
MIDLPAGLFIEQINATPRRPVAPFISSRRAVSPDHRGGARRKPLKTIAQGRPAESAGICGDDARVVISFRTRGYGCSGRPAFPAPSFSGAKDHARLGRVAPPAALQETGFHWKPAYSMIIVADPIGSFHAQLGKHCYRGLLSIDAHST